VNIFLVECFFKFCLRIWNQCKILHFLVPILTYLKKKVFSSISKKILGSLYSFTLWFCLGGGDAVHTLLPGPTKNLRPVQPKTRPLEKKLDRNWNLKISIFNKLFVEVKNYLAIHKTVA